MTNAPEKLEIEISVISEDRNLIPIISMKASVAGLHHDVQSVRQASERVPRGRCRRRRTRSLAIPQSRIDIKLGSPGGRKDPHSPFLLQVSLDTVGIDPGVGYTG